MSNQVRELIVLAGYLGMILAILGSDAGTHFARFVTVTILTIAVVAYYLKLG